MESYFKRAKPRQVPEKGKVSLVSAFFFFETQLSPKSPRIGAVAGAESIPNLLHPALTPVLRSSVPVYQNVVFSPRSLRQPVARVRSGGDLQPTAVPEPLRCLEPDPKYPRVGRDDR